MVIAQVDHPRVSHTRSIEVQHRQTTALVSLLVLTWSSQKLSSSQAQPKRVASPPRALRAPRIAEPSPSALNTSRKEQEDGTRHQPNLNWHTEAALPDQHQSPTIPTPSTWGRLYLREDS